jgi:outer membrane protein TolC
MKILWLYALLLACLSASLNAQQENGASQADEKSVPQGGLQLDDLVRNALERNPEAQSVEHGIKALERKVPQAKALPDPMVGVGWMGNLAPFSTMSGDPSSYRGVTVSEQFPYPGKLKLQGAIAGKDVEAAQTDYDAIRRRVTAEVKTAYYEYFYFDKAIQSTSRNKDLLEKLSKIAEAQYRVGKSMQQDVLRSQVEISLLIEKLTTLEQQKETARARINAFLLQSPDSPIAPAAEVQPDTIQYSLDELYALATKNDTTVERNQKMIDRGKLGVDLAKKQYRPDFGVSYAFQQRTDQADMNGFMFSVNIPVFYRSKQRQAEAEASEDVLSAEKMRDNRLNEVRFELKQQYLAAKAAERLISLYSKAIVPQSSLALESSMAAYQVGKVDFLSLIANFTTVLNYETDYYRQLADYETAIARMESLTGVDVTSKRDTSPAEPTTEPTNRSM